MTPKERAKYVVKDFAEIGPPTGSTAWLAQVEDLIAGAICDAVAEAEVSQVRPEVAAFALAMEKKLKANDHKGGWKHCDRDYLMTRLRQEFVELIAAMHFPLDDGQIDRIELRDEAADVANFLMMILDVEGVLR